ncbi:hypothetical protein Rsub_00448 [Raphidocelis subcapitata]|uniref:Palmitoyl-protein thioesterase ABHD10, mitochondrial n=1 Tax=Raphidocelis subcapitata TaxID=307507 RepID=A0A2V0NS28_9CHLO|nr:hypothetical protein Rsub_00448 [Raphidocelis subcapitata]|eukprot:GBF87737.1 hypothetical protein Rsub_00448 [Raphidocelis subcapitata]
MAQPTAFLQIPGRRIAYARSGAGAGPAQHPRPRAGVVFLGGLLSNMAGVWRFRRLGPGALALEAFVSRNLPACEFLRFDYRGHGESSGSFTDTTPADWMDDAEAAFDRLTDPAAPQIVVGSSMGGLFALHLALRFPSRVAALVLVAPAVGTFAAWHAALSPEERAALASGGSIRFASDYAPPGSDRVRLGFFQPFLRGGALALPDGEGAVRVAPDCPVRILHGECDDVVPIATSHALLRQLAADDVALTVVKRGDHRLSGPRDLALLEAAVAQVHRQLEAAGRLLRPGADAGGGGAAGGAGS